MAAPDRPRPALFLRPHVFFPVLIALIAISVMLTPTVDTNEGAPTLTSHSATANGAKGLADVARRLGWRVSELEEPLSPTLTPDAIYAVLVNSRALTDAEAHILLDRIRAGAGALVLVGSGGGLDDSLHLSRSARPGALRVPASDSVSCPAPRRTLADFATRLPLIVTPVRATAPLASDTAHIATVHNVARRDSLRRDAVPAAIGIPFGRGRVVAIADARLLTNDVIRVCHWGAGVVAVRALEWVSERDGEGPRKSLVFDEFHHGYGRHGSVTHAIWDWLGTTQPGRTTAQLAIAALLLLLAAAPRPIAPLARTSIPRRSPLEHVSALAQAYEQVKATRTAARLLVQGVRRRAAQAAGARHTTEEQFIAAVAARFPSLRDDAARVRRAMVDTVPPAELLEVASTIDRIERSVRP